MQTRKHIPFHIPFVSGQEKKYIQQAIEQKAFSGDGYFGRLCEQWLEGLTGAKGVLLTSSCTHALEMCALLCDIQPGDEVIMPSFNFVSAANAFALRGAKIVFVDIRPDTMNVDEKQIEIAISKRTKAIVVVHYGGVSCDMDRISRMAEAQRITVIEDAAHGIGSYYKDQHLGTFGKLGTLSFHASKNIHCGEGGALIINDPDLIERAEIIREKGTNRKEFERGKISEYSWVGLGSSYLMSEINAAFLLAQLKHLEKVNERRQFQWQEYEKLCRERGVGEIFSPPNYPYQSNGHLFFLKAPSFRERKALSNFLLKSEIYTPFHYIPLHTSKMGRRQGRMSNRDVHTSEESSRLLRLPLFHSLSREDIHYVVQSVASFTNSL